MGTALLPVNTAPSVWGGPIAIQRTRTDPLNSDTSTADTIGILQGHVQRYANDPFVIAATGQALGPFVVATDGIQSFDVDASDREVASAIFHWVRGRVRFVEDEALMYHELGVEPDRLDKELLLAPPTLLSMPVPMGDCDDFSLLIACQLSCAGVQPYFVTVAADPFDRRKFSHIYVVARLEDEDGYLCLDAGNRLAAIPPGWENSRITRKAIWEASS